MINSKNQKSLHEINLFVEPGHFYSPIFASDSSLNIRGYPPNSSELNLNSQSQLNLLSDISKSGTIFPKEKTSTNKYFSNNEQFAEGDAFILSGILNKLNPRRIVEIGSGFSTAVIYDTKKNLTNLEAITLIEPFPERLNNLLTLDRDTVLIQKKVQDVELSIFQELEAGDVLFIDSTHVAKTNSDVLFEILIIIPLLKPGVWVHFHDMFWPFEYPLEWIQQGRSWNELYFIRAWLAYNQRVTVQFFSHYLSKEHKKAWKSFLPRQIKNPGGALWISIN